MVGPEGEKTERFAARVLREFLEAHHLPAATTYFDVGWGPRDG